MGVLGKFRRCSDSNNAFPGNVRIVRCLSYQKEKVECKNTSEIKRENRKQTRREEKGNNVVERLKG